MPLCEPSPASSSYAKVAWAVLARGQSAVLQQRRVSRVSRGLSSLVSRASGGALFRVLLNNGSVVARAETADQAWRDWRLFESAVDKTAPPGLGPDARCAFLAQRVFEIVTADARRLADARAEADREASASRRAAVELADAGAEEKRREAVSDDGSSDAYDESGGGGGGAADAYAARAAGPAHAEARRFVGLTEEEARRVAAAHSADAEWLRAGAHDGADADDRAAAASTLAPLLASDRARLGRVFPVDLGALPTEERWAVAGLLTCLAAAQMRREAAWAEARAPTAALAARQPSAAVAVRAAGVAGRGAAGGGPSERDLERSRALWTEFSRQVARGLGLADDDPSGARRGAMALLVSAARTGPAPDAAPFVDGVRSRAEALVASAEMVVLAFGGLDSRAQQVLRGAAAELGASWGDLLRLESLLAERMQMELSEEDSLEAGGREAATAPRSNMDKLKVGGLAVSGAILMALTGGLAAPAIGAAVSSLGLGSAAVLGTAHGALATATVFGAAGGGLTHYKAQRRYGQVTEFAFDQVQAAGGAADEGAMRHLPVVMAVSGFLCCSAPENEEEARAAAARPWEQLPATHARDCDVYAVRWETRELAALGDAVATFASSSVKSYAAREVAMRTIVGGLVAAVTWPVTVLSAASVVDNPFGVCLNKASKAAPALADALAERAHGRRPVTLVAYGMGALLAFLALEELARRQDALDREQEPAEELRGIVHDVVLLGTPVPADPARWNAVRTLVAGRLVNGFSYADWVLRLAARVESGAVAGCAPVRSPNVENFDLSELVQGHLQYAARLPEILDEIKFRPGYRAVDTAMATLIGAAEPASPEPESETTALLR